MSQLDENVIRIPQRNGSVSKKSLRGILEFKTRSAWVDFVQKICDTDLVFAEKYQKSQLNKTVPPEIAYQIAQICAPGMVIRWDFN